MPSANSAHAFTNPRERIPDITATGVNVPTETFRTAAVDDAVGTVEARRASDAANAVIAPQTQRPHKSLSDILPPLVFGTATFNYQFNPDPYALSPNDIVKAALQKGIRAFDTSPYYGPAEEILGAALHSPLVTGDGVLSQLRRTDYFILTKCGRIHGDEFDYSPKWIRYSVARSLKRLKTDYLDVVYLHDVEFVSSEDVLRGVRALRAIRDQTGRVRYVGICGYPVDVLCELAEMIRKETGESVDIVQSYANYTVQNQRLVTEGLERLERAGVGVVTNASPLGMGLCRSQGVPVGDSKGSWHPAPDGLRRACLDAARWVEREWAERLETVAVRFAMEGWLTAGAEVGVSGLLPDEAIARLKGTCDGKQGSADRDGIDTARPRPRLGVSVMGVSRLSELEETMAVHGNILSASSASSNARKEQVEKMVTYLRENILGRAWSDFAWDSPDPGFKNTRKEFGVSEAERKDFQCQFGEEYGVQLGQLGGGSKDSKAAIPS